MRAQNFFIIFLVLLATVILSFFFPPFYAAMLIPAVALGAILLGNPRRLLFVYLIVMSFYALLGTVVPTTLMQYVDELFALVLFGVMFGHIVFRRMDFDHIKGFGKIAPAMLAYAVISWLINRGSPRAAAQCLLSYFLFIPVVMISWKYLRKSDFIMILKATIVFFWINFLLNVGWLLHLNPLPNIHLASGNLVDAAKGLFGACNTLAYFCVMFLFLLISVLNSRLALGGKLRNWIYITLPVTLFQLHLTYTNHAIIFFGIALIPFLIASKLWKNQKTVLVVVGLVAAAILAFSFSEDVRIQFNEKNFRGRMESFRFSAKGKMYQSIMVDNLLANPAEWAFGVGPGNGAGKIGKDNRTSYALRMLLEFYTQSSGQSRKMQMQSISGRTEAGILTLWGDFGLFGTGIFLAAYVWVYLRCWRLVFLGSIDPIKKTLAEFFVGVLTFFFVLNLVVDLFGSYLFLGWLWMLVPFLFQEDDVVEISNESTSIQVCCRSLPIG